MFDRRVIALAVVLGVTGGCGRLDACRYSLANARRTRGDGCLEPMRPRQAQLPRG
jgi:hypothetical protein